MFGNLVAGGEPVGFSLAAAVVVRVAGAGVFLCRAGVALLVGVEPVVLGRVARTGEASADLST